MLFLNQVAWSHEFRALKGGSIVYASKHLIRSLKLV